MSNIFNFGGCRWILETFCRLVIKKWRNIKDQWAKSIKKMKDQEKNGSRTRTPRKYIYHEQLLFLKNTDAKVIKSNISVEIPQNIPICSAPIPKRQKIDLQKEIIDTLKEEDRHLLFFKGVLPSVREFTEDETLQFQMGIITLIQTIKKSRTVAVKLDLTN